ncbi:MULTISPECIES: pseudouridine synthase [Persicobacter]|uniref:Pseudouridine synthase n=1 Tax=Persicobacter diffluens TaxID=981 RepID=A0AAN4W1E3_9BACT|nr:pseudouridine synthase [Persicobacter sp. CCB-QB2]GJM62135.1 hypothetical protein PEDI_26870 [Persicobacter diffluens]
MTKARRSNSGRRYSGGGKSGSGRPGAGKTSHKKKFDRSRSAEHKPESDEKIAKKQRSLKEIYKDRQAASESTNTPNYNFRKMKELAKKKAAKSGGEEGAPQSYAVRLNKFIANAGVCSRREADRLISEGEISVNGKVVREMGYKVEPKDKVSWQGKLLSREKSVYVLLNKPKDFLTTTDDPKNRKTVMELVKKAAGERIYPVGRLDRMTTGLLLLTNDGELAEKLAHPSNNVRKIYQVELDKPITEEDFAKIQNTIELEDGPVPVDDLVILSSDAKSLGIEIHLGRNRIVRRTFEHLGYEVVKLDRVVYAGLDKKDLPRGKWRYLSEKELIHLKYFL